MIGDWDDGPTIMFTFVLLQVKANLNTGSWNQKICDQFE